MELQAACASPQFKLWLVATLEPICDAEPDVLAEFVLALLTDGDTAKQSWTEVEWANYTANELNDFLGDASQPFVQKLFDTIRTKSYLAQPVPHIAPAQDAMSVDASMAGPSTQPQGEIVMGDGSQPPRRKPCRDYHERGFCMRGETCPYEHSSDVIIPTPEMMMAQMGQMGGPQFMPHGGRGGFGGRGRGRGRGRGGPPGMPFDPRMMPMMPGMPPMPFFPGGPGPQGREGPPPEFALGATRPPRDRNGETLLITDIPPANLNMGAIRDYFGQFGDVTNVAVEGKSRRALVSFATNREAYAAWKSDEAVFGSRHVKVLWHKPRPGQGGAGQKLLAQSSQLIANMKKLESGESTQGDHVATLEGPESRLKKTLAELEVKEKRQKKETLIAEQKVLFARAASASQDDKVAILNRVKEISKEMADLDKPAPQEPDTEMTDKAKLDAELAKHGMETTVGKDQEELLKLNEQLAALRDKASTLGIPATRYSPYGRGSPRGRARGRGRGRGGFTRPMRLDNRSKTVLISGDALASDQDRQAVKEWYESTGGVLEQSGDGVLVTYPSREMAEKALALGTKDINARANVIAQWHSAPQNGNGDLEVHMGGQEQPERDAGEVEMGDDSDRRERDE